VNFNRSFKKLSPTMAIAIAALSLSAHAAGYPDRPIKLLVGFTAGGGADGVARLLGEAMARVLGQPLVVENRPGAGTTLAASVLAKSAPTARP